MEFESPDVEKDFPGLYASESGGKKSNAESDFSDDSHEKHKKDLLKSKEKKESKKDRGYAALEGESSPDEAEGDIRSPSKSKKSKSFKFPSKKREKSREKEVSREVDPPKEQKEKKRDKDSLRPKLRKDKKTKTKHSEDGSDVAEEPPVFGVPLEVAVSRSRCHDGIQLPLIVRNCLDFVEECGLTVEGIYKSSGNKSRAQQLRKMYNQKDPVSFTDCDPATVAGLLKVFLRELPEPVVSTTLTSELEESASKRGEGMDVLLSQLPQNNRELLGWMVIHCKHLVANEKLNKCGGLQGVCATFAPLLQTSPKVLSALICYASSLFPNIQLSRYIPPLSGPSPALPSSEAGCLEELRKLESLLAQVHGEMAAGLTGQRREEQLWDAQRIVTQLKRKLRALQKPLEPRASDDELRMELRHEDDSTEPPATVPSNPVIVSSGAATVPCANNSTVVAPVIATAAVTQQSQTEQLTEGATSEAEDTTLSEQAEVPSESQVVPEESSKITSTNEEDSIVPECSPDMTDSKADIEEADLDVCEDEELQCEIIHQLETLARQLADRVAAERAEVYKLRQELEVAREEGRVRTPEKSEANDPNIGEILEQKQVLQAQRDELCRLICEEREAVARAKAVLIVKQRQQQAAA